MYPKSKVFHRRVKLSSSDAVRSYIINTVTVVRISVQRIEWDIVLSVTSVHCSTKRHSIGVWCMDHQVRSPSLEAVWTCVDTDHRPLATAILATVDLRGYWLFSSFSFVCLADYQDHTSLRGVSYLRDAVFALIQSLPSPYTPVSYWLPPGFLSP